MIDFAVQYCTILGGYVVFVVSRYFSNLSRTSDIAVIIAIFDTRCSGDRPAAAVISTSCLIFSWVLCLLCVEWASVRGDLLTHSGGRIVVTIADPRVAHCVFLKDLLGNLNIPCDPTEAQYRLQGVKSRVLFVHETIACSNNCSTVLHSRVRLLFVAKKNVAWSVCMCVSCTTKLVCVRVCVCRVCVPLYYSVVSRKLYGGLHGFSFAWHKFFIRHREAPRSKRERRYWYATVQFAFSSLLFPSLHFIYFISSHFSCSFPLPSAGMILSAPAVV